MDGEAGEIAGGIGRGWNAILAGVEFGGFESLLEGERDGGFEGQCGRDDFGEAGFLGVVLVGGECDGGEDADDDNDDHELDKRKSRNIFTHIDSF